MRLFWHRLRGHRVAHRRVTAPLWDPWATGQLIECSCGKEWAR